MDSNSSSTLLNLSKAPESMTRIEITAGLKINSLINKVSGRKNSPAFSFYLTSIAMGFSQHFNSLV